MYNSESERNKTVYIRKLKKRIAYLEEKLHAIRENTTLMEHGVVNSASGGRVKRQARRIDYLEGRLLVIREIANTFCDTMCAEDGRHIAESRVKQGCIPHQGINIGGGKLDAIDDKGAGDGK